MGRNITAAQWQRLGKTQELLARVPPQLQRLAERREIDARSTLFRRGDKPRDIFCVIAGEVRLVRCARNGAEIVLQRACRGFLAEASLWSRIYHCDAVAAEPSAVVRFPAAAFRAALDGDALFRSAWIQHLAAELRGLRAHYERLSLRAAADRIVHYIESEGSDGALILTRSRKAWAVELGLTHEALYRSLARLASSGVLLVEGNRLALKRVTGRLRPSGRSSG